MCSLLPLYFRHFRVLLMAFALICAPAAYAFQSAFEGAVVRVKDGDSVIVRRMPQKRLVEIRLAGIDAPELAQPWGIQSRTALRRMIDGKTVRVEVTDTDRYNRRVARLYVGRTYVNAELVRAGHAWAFSRYLNDDKVRQAQIEARKAKRGLWTLKPADRLPPPTWRARNPRRSD